MTNPHDSQNKHRPVSGGKRCPDCKSFDTYPVNLARTIRACKRCDCYFDDLVATRALMRSDRRLNR